MKYVPPIGATDPNAPYITENLAAGVEGSPVAAEAIEHPQREILAVITGAGLTPNEENLGQLRDAIEGMIAAAIAASAIDPVATTRDMLGGTIVEWEAAAIPTLADGKPLGLELNGSIISLTTYPRLLRKWPGAGANATAPVWYRCTAGGTRDAAGGYIKLQDRRAEFPRGWDHGRGVDAGRVLGSAQGGTNMSNGTLYSGGVVGAGIIQPISNLENTSSVTSSTANSNTPTATASITSGDVRVRSVATMFIVLV
ncbi:phage tail protein [Nitratidesulfovibrio liaohensis]|uniref:phage tail protein n=1 Tax=Nitratidesulfovibrio liaohensis TaxID=2604158 RepID=UPI001AAF9DF6|nr:phage tail protein [Nitratidesulfovibrio liaohensis]NHZ45509.1 phage tail protein [Nitratidesulfovibrio liaohensis]